jgi:hypothetical protein
MHSKSNGPRSPHALWQVFDSADEQLPMFDQSENLSRLRTSAPALSTSSISDLRKVAHDYAATWSFAAAAPVFKYIRDNLQRWRNASRNWKDESAHGRMAKAHSVAPSLWWAPTAIHRTASVHVPSKMNRIANLIIPRFYARAAKAARHAGRAARGRVTLGQVWHVLAFDSFKSVLDTVDLDSRSRDFH